MPRSAPIELHRLGGLAQQALADVTALLGPDADEGSRAAIERALKVFGVALARMIRTRKRHGLVSRPAAAVTAWIREQRVVASPDGIGYEVLRPGGRGPKTTRSYKQPPLRLQELNLHGKSVAATLAAAAQEQLADDRELVEGDRMVSLAAISEYFQLAEDALLERWRQKAARRACAWPMHYGGDDWRLPLSVFTDQKQFLKRQEREEPAHLAPLPDGYEL